MAKIVVTEEHIKEGKPGSPKHCAVALAAQEVFPEAEVGVGVRGIYVDGEDYKISLLLPRAAQDFVVKFDSGGEVEPFEFEAPESTRSRVRPKIF